VWEGSGSRKDEAKNGGAGGRGLGGWAGCGGGGGGEQGEKIRGGGGKGSLTWGDRWEGCGSSEGVCGEKRVLGKGDLRGGQGDDGDGRGKRLANGRGGWAMWRGGEVGEWG